MTVGVGRRRGKGRVCRPRSGRGVRSENVARSIEPTAHGGRPGPSSSDLSPDPVDNPLDERWLGGRPRSPRTARSDAARRPGRDRARSAPAPDHVRTADRTGSRRRLAGRQALATMPEGGFDGTRPSTAVRTGERDRSGIDQFRLDAGHRFRSRGNDPGWPRAARGGVWTGAGRGPRAAPQVTPSRSSCVCSTSIFTSRSIVSFSASFACCSATTVSMLPSTRRKLSSSSGFDCPRWVRA